MLFGRRAGLTQEELAGRAGYSTDYISKLERDQRVLPVAAVDRLATILALGEDERAALGAARERRAGGEVGAARPLAGRDGELAELGRHLAGLGPPVLLFAGEPGIGKTRLLEEAAASAAQSGWRVLAGGCQRRGLDPTRRSRARSSRRSGASPRLSGHGFLGKVAASSC